MSNLHFLFHFNLILNPFNLIQKKKKWNHTVSSSTPRISKYLWYSKQTSFPRSTSSISISYSSTPQEQMRDNVGWSSINERAVAFSRCDTRFTSPLHDRARFRDDSRETSSTGNVGFTTSINRRARPPFIFHPFDRTRSSKRAKTMEARLRAAAPYRPRDSTGRS